MTGDLSAAISECHTCETTPGGRAYKKLLEAAIEDWTSKLIESDDDKESTMLKGAVRHVRYILKRVEEKQIKK